MAVDIENLRDVLARAGITSELIDNGTVLRVVAPYEKVLDVLSKAGYRYGFFVGWNPFHHRGGKEFRTGTTPGFHFKVNYPQFDPPEPSTRLSDFSIGSIRSSRISFGRICSIFSTRR